MSTTITVAYYAERLARSAHGDDLNKHDGEPYIHHVERVVAHLIDQGANEVIQAIAWLHDVVEDTDVTLLQIRAAFGPHIADAVDALTHRHHEPRVDYYARLGPNRDALIVKIADGRDNQDPARKAVLPEATRERLALKYFIQNRILAEWTIHHLKEI